jgi:hypothetical protein
MHNKSNVDRMSDYTRDEKHDQLRFRRYRDVSYFRLSLPTW